MHAVIEATETSAGVAATFYQQLAQEEAITLEMKLPATFVDSSAHHPRPTSHHTDHHFPPGIDPLARDTFTSRLARKAP